MTKMSEPVVFFGSGPVAARSLELLSKYADIEAVVTKPRQADHKGDVPVLDLAKNKDLSIITAKSKSELSKQIAAANFTSRVAVLVDFGIIVSKDVIESFPMGIVNSHFSILPEWRGADPISFAILSGQAQTGVSLMLLVEAMDAGPLLAYGTYDLPSDITGPKLTQDLIELSDALLRHELPRYMADNTMQLPQTVTGRGVSYSRKITKEDGIIDWEKPATQLEREIRAFLEWPKSHTKLDGIEVIISSARAHSTAHKEAPGTIRLGHDSLTVACGKGELEIDSLKPAGKPEMSSAAFLAGYGNRLKL